MNIKTITLILLLTLSASLMASDWSAADKAYAKGEFQKAFDLYSKARLKNGDDRRLNLNLGSTLYRLERFDEAKTELGQAIYSQDSSIAAQASYNLANVQYRLGQKADKPADRIAAWREAIALCKRAIDLQPKHDKAKRNAEFINAKLKEELEKQKKEQEKNNQKQDQKPLSDAAKQALARAMQLTSQGKYKEAKAILEQIMSTDESAAQLQDEMQRIQDLWDISEGREPSAPVDASQSTQDLQVI